MPGPSDHAVSIPRGGRSRQVERLVGRGMNRIGRSATNIPTSKPTAPPYGPQNTSIEPSEPAIPAAKGAETAFQKRLVNTAATNANTRMDARFAKGTGVPLTRPSSLCTKTKTSKTLTTTLASHRKKHTTVRRQNTGRLRAWNSIAARCQCWLAQQCIGYTSRLTTALLGKPAVAPGGSWDRAKHRCPFSGHAGGPDVFPEKAWLSCWTCSEKRLGDSRWFGSCTAESLSCYQSAAVQLPHQRREVGLFAQPRVTSSPERTSSKAGRPVQQFRSASSSGSRLGCCHDSPFTGVAKSWL